MKDDLIKMLKEEGFDYRVYNDFEVVIYHDDIDTHLASFNLNTGDAVYTLYCMKLDYRKRDGLRYTLESLQSEMLNKIRF